MSKTESIKKKLANLDVSGLVQGAINKKTGRMQGVAEDRAKICAECDMNQPEPIEELSVSDSIESISGRYCEACGCALPYLLRQNRKKCKLGKW